MSEKLNTAIAVIGIDIGKNSFHVVGHDQRGAIVLHQKWSRGQVAARRVAFMGCNTLHAYQPQPRSSGIAHRHSNADFHILAAERSTASFGPTN